MNAPSKDEFRGVIGTHFPVVFDDGTVVTLSLDEVNEKKHLDTGDLENFQLIFSASKENRLLQATFRIEHEVLGELFLFLVPIEQSEDRFFYEAAFSRKV